MMELFNSTGFRCSELITQAYSTSFTLGIKTLDKRLHAPIYGIYAYVRYADEIVDTFHDYDKSALLAKYRAETFRAIEDGISLNPVLQSFQQVVNKYDISYDLIDSFLDSMEMDLHFDRYNEGAYNQYIYGSAEVVGLMCLKVFCDGDKTLYEKLMPAAKSLGSAFQKVNFLRDLQADYVERGRVYFPGMNFSTFDEEAKVLVEDNIQADFDAAYEGIMMLPKGSKLGVYLAYVYYLTLFSKIKKSAAEVVKQERIRVSNRRKFGLLVGTYLRSSLNIL